MRNLTSNQKVFLCLFLTLVFALSLAYSFYFRIQPTVDAKAYDEIARNIVAGNGYRESLDMPLAEDNAIMRVGPGYEFFLAFLYFIFGHHYEVVWVVQAFLLTLTAWLVFLTSREIFWDQWAPAIGFIAAAFISFSPDLITMQGMLMTETLGIFLIVLSIYLFFRLANSFSSGSLLWLSALVALSLGLAALVRTPSIILALPMGGYLLWQGRWKDIVLMTVVGILVFTPWIVRNYQVYHVFVPTNLAYGIDLAAGNHPGASGELEPYSRNDEMIAQYGKVGATRKLTKEAILFIIYNPVEFLRITTRRISIYFSFARPTGFWFHLSGISKLATLVLSAIYSILLFTFGFLGITKIKSLPVERRAKAWFFLAMLIMMLLAIVGIIVETRYRFLSYPFFAIFAGYGISQLRKENACWTCFASIFFLLLANTGIDILNNLDRIFERIQTF